MAPRVFISLVVLLAALAAGALLLGGDDEPAAPARVDPSSVYDPVAAGETLPDGYRRGLDRDQIDPVYSPRFTSAASVVWPDDSLVIGVAGAMTSKAYPVTHLNSHEMVLDSLDDDPILVSW